MSVGIVKGERLRGIAVFFAAIAVLGTLVFAVLLFYFAAFEGAAVFGADAEDVNAANRLWLALFCCLLAVMLIVLAFFGLWTEKLLPAAAAAYALAAVLCGVAASAAEDAWILGLGCVLLALLTPWWRLGTRVRVIGIALLGAVSVPLLLFWWDAFDTSEWICQPVPADVVARMNGAMTRPEARVRGAAAARTTAVPGRWIVAADVQGMERSPDDQDKPLWLVVEGDNPPDGQLQPSDTILAVNSWADLATNFPEADLWQSDITAIGRAVDCATAAAGRGWGAPGKLLVGALQRRAEVVSFRRRRNLG